MKRRILFLLLAGITAMTPVTAYAADTFEGWNDSKVTI